MEFFIVTDTPMQLSEPRDRVLSIREFSEGFLRQPITDSLAFLVDIGSLDACDERVARDIACKPNVHLFSWTPLAMPGSASSYGAANTPVYALDPAQASRLIRPAAVPDRQREAAKAERLPKDGLAAKAYDFLFRRRRLRVFVVAALLVPFLIVMALSFFGPLLGSGGATMAAVMGLTVIPVSMVYGLIGIVIRLYEKISGGKV